MSEEIGNPGMEVNEAALEQVGGGIALPNDPIARAGQFCTWCPKRGRGKCAGRPRELADYMREHGMIDGYGACPF